MIASLAKLIDWLSIQRDFRRMPPIDGRSLRLEEALQFLKGADFIPAESQPAKVEFNPDKSGLHFRFSTPRPSGFVENNVVYGRFYRCAGRWQERPAIILLHGGNMMRGGNDAIGYRFRQPLTAHCCNRAGFNVATVELPYHFQRSPRQQGALNNLNYLRLAQAAAQAVAEIRALIGWLLVEGCPAVALWGTSMGGRLAGLVETERGLPAGAVCGARSQSFGTGVQKCVLEPEAAGHIERGMKNRGATAGLRAKMPGAAAQKHPGFQFGKSFSR
jgi:hypothetical protein